MSFQPEQYLYTQLEKHPLLQSYARRTRMTLWKQRVALQASLSRPEIDPARMFVVSPDKITRAGIGWDDSSRERTPSKIAGGDWDLKVMPFEDLDVYQGLKAHFIDGVRWEEVGYYKILLARIEAGMHSWGIHTCADLEKYLNDLDLLFQEKGAQLQSPSSAQATDQITVRIGRDGQFLAENGQHQLVLAKLLRLPQIPVRVTWRHTDWVQLRLEILDYAHSHGGKVYAPITHPDLADIPWQHGTRRCQLICSHLPFNSGTLLDIGAHWGYFCHKFEEYGFHCYAVEVGAREFYFLERLKLAEQRNFITVSSDIFNFQEKNEFDVVLALNIFHHFIKTEQEYKKLVWFLHRLKTKVMFFEPHLPDESQMRGAYRNFENDEFVRFVAENTGLTHCEHIGNSEDSRPVYKLTGEGAA